MKKYLLLLTFAITSCVTSTHVPRSVADDLQKDVDQLKSQLQKCIKANREFDSINKNLGRRLKKYEN